MLLPRTTEDLVALQRFLEKRCGVLYTDISVKWSQDEDQRNISDPRGFCHTEQGSMIISCSRALEDVDREIRLGVLIHEIGHIVLNAFDGEESEVDVDTWVIDTLPKGSYGYLQDYAYLNSLIEEQVTAHNIQRVTTTFSRSI